MFTAVYRHLPWWLVVATLLGNAPAGARQLSFAQQSINTELRLAYQFEVPGARRPLPLSFALPSAEVREARGAFRRFNPDDLKRRWARERTRLLKQELVLLKRSYPDATLSVNNNGRISYTLSPKRANAHLREARTRDIDNLLRELRGRYPHVRISYQVSSGRVQMSGIRSAAEQNELNAALRSRLQALEQTARLRLKRLANQADGDSQRLSRQLNDAIERVYTKLDGFEAEYLEARYYTFSSTRVVQPDYGRIARESLISIKPLAEAWAGQHGIPPSRAALNQLLGFFQSIPYDTLESRNTTDGAGFAMPVALLARNRGDCDTKSVAMAALVHALAPQIPTIMVLLSDHALLGFAVKQRRGDATLQYNGRTYVLAEPVGPALQPMGRIGKRSRERARQILQLFEPAALPRS